MRQQSSITTTMLRILIWSTVLSAMTLPLHAAEEPKPTLEAQMARPFRNHAVLQQNVELPVWGTSLPGAKVTLTFDNQTKTTTADANGAWRIVLDPMKAVQLPDVNAAPVGKTMRVTTEKDGQTATHEIHDMVLGEVWLGSGQSNMAGTFRPIFVKKTDSQGRKVTTSEIKPSRLPYYPEAMIRNVGYPWLRQMSSKHAEWIVCSSETLPDFNKVCFFFGRRLYRELKVPVGVINPAVGGSRIETWLNQKPYEIGGNYRKLVTPYIGFVIRGFLWYQGESNADERRRYEPKLKSLITGWRKVWGQGDFPAYVVQLPGIGVSPKDNPAMGDGRAEIRQTCVEILKLPNTGLAVCMDVGGLHEHPPNKLDIGLRLAHAALHKTYGMTTIPVSPLYQEHKVEGRAIRVTFSNAGSGLMIAKKEGIQPPKPVDGPLGWLSIQAKDGTWHWAEGTIDGSDLIVSSKDVSEPVAVRYAYTTHPTPPLLYSKEGLPVGPFSTIGYGPEARD